MSEFAALKQIINDLRPCANVLVGLEEVKKVSDSPNDIFMHLWSGELASEDFRTEEQEDFLTEYLCDDSSVASWRHPLHIEIFPAINGRSALRLGYLVDQKCNLLEEHLENGDLIAFVFCYSRPFRLDGFLSVIYAMDKDGGDSEVIEKQYWELLNTVWVDSEDPCVHESNVTVWRNLWDNGFGFAAEDKVCLDYDREKFDALPEVITLYRAGELSGLSWTTSKKTALFFKDRRSKDCKLWMATINKSDVKWFTDERGESEIVVTDIDTLQDVTKIG